MHVQSWRRSRSASAERRYPGIHGKWQSLQASENEVMSYLDEHWSVAAFCGKRGFTVSLMVEQVPRIGNECIERFHAILQTRRS